AEESDWIPSLEELNLAHYFPEGSDSSIISESYAYDAFQQLMREDSNWMSSIYAYSDCTPAELASRLGLSTEQVMGGYNPDDSSHDKNDASTWTIHSFKTIRVSATDGDGHAITPKSNVLDILSMANTYTYFQGADQYDLFLSYAQALWELSHSYSVSISDVYYCPGCVGDQAEENERAELEAELAQEEQEWCEYEEEESLSDNSESVSSIVTAGSSGTKGSESGFEYEAESQSAIIQAGSSSQDTESATEEASSEDISTADRSVEDDSADTSADFISHATTKETIAAFPSDNESLPTVREKETVREAEIVRETEDVREAEPVRTASQANADSSRSGTNKASHSNASYCPGHVDLIVHLKITGLDEETNNLFSLDTIGNDPSDIGNEEGQWPGWTDEMKTAARNLAAQDWYEKYGLSVSIISPGKPLTETEIASYMALLPDDISDTRRELIRFALNSIGKVPYYWGGKPAHPGYEGNNFGIPVSPDVDGRILKGLDCSGWINWVYWSVTGERLPYESTAGLAFTGRKISREELRPGDIIIRTGSNAHVIMFLGWETNGNVLCINETSGSDNNVVISSREANWPYYRCLVD
ncbi:MAG: NlpC/P60 family protein, partial [Clostridiales bacterium]|nr:NlpC/P60 family protein [Clostridiales bacterium]